MHIRLSCRRYDLVHWHQTTIVTVRNVLGYRSIEQHRLLRNQTNLRAQTCQRIVNGPDAIHINAALFGIIVAQQQLNARGLSATGRSD